MHSIIIAHSRGLPRVAQRKFILKWSRNRNAVDRFRVSHSWARLLGCLRIYVESSIFFWYSRNCPARLRKSAWQSATETRTKRSNEAVTELMRPFSKQSLGILKRGMHSISNFEHLEIVDISKSLLMGSWENRRNAPWPYRYLRLSLAR